MAILVSGCPRSGTSVMMDCLRSVFGEDRLMGCKFTDEAFLREPVRFPGEDVSMFNIRAYLTSKKQEQFKLDESVMDMNPNGFWECMYTVTGIVYNFSDRAALKKLEKSSINNATILKVVSQGLLNTDPKYISKVIYMRRHPRAVAKSQEKLTRGFDVEDADGEVVNIADGLVVHTPSMYIEVTLLACQWLIAHPDIPVHFVDFEELQERPKEVLEGIASFLGVDSFEKAYDIVEPRLNRSKHEDIPNTLWEDSEFVYEKFKEGNYSDILKYFEDPSRAYNREKMQWMCHRYGEGVDTDLCQGCRKNPTIRRSLKESAEKRGVNWHKEPCVFECGLSFEGTPRTIQESIDDNFWEED